MINLEYHKGQQCVHRNLYCQEGYCSECQVYLDLNLDKEVFFKLGNKKYFMNLPVKEMELAIN
jgi:hypothetical protein